MHHSKNKIHFFYFFNSHLAYLFYFFSLYSDHLFRFCIPMRKGVGLTPDQLEQTLEQGRMTVLIGRMVITD